MACGCARARTSWRARKRSRVTTRMAAPGITVLKHNVPWGPFTREQIEDGLTRGDFTVKYLAHAPGLKEWLPLGEVIDYVERTSSSSMPSLPPVPSQRELPPVPEQPSIKAEPAP